MSIFDTEGGTGRTTEYSGEIVDWFAAENEYGTSVNVHTLLTNPEDFPWMADGIAKEFFNAGPDWKPANGGQTLVHPTKSQPNANTDLGRLFSQMKLVDGAEQALSPSALDGANWKGKKFRWAAVEWKTNAFTGRDGTEVAAKIKVKAMPVELLGAAASNGHKADFDLTSLGADADALTLLRSIRSGADSYTKFQSALIGASGQLGQPLFKAVSDAGEGAYRALETI